MGVDGVFALLLGDTKCFARNRLANQGFSRSVGGGEEFNFTLTLTPKASRPRELRPLSCLAANLLLVFGLRQIVLVGYISSTVHRGM